MNQHRKLIVGNWKMNGLRADVARLVAPLAEKVRSTGATCQLLLCPPATLLTLVRDATYGSGILLGAQDCHALAAGPFTGNLSAEMLKDAGCSHVIVGHSERRQGHGESDADVKAKVAAAWRAGLVAIVCAGETREQRDSGRSLDVIVNQLTRSVPNGATADNLVVAYEPVWAIGSGLIPTPVEISNVNAAVAACFSLTRIVYGGSVTARNAADILNNVDGALVGGASLQVEDFWTIARAA